MPRPAASSPARRAESPRRPAADTQSRLCPGASSTLCGEEEGRGMDAATRAAELADMVAAAHGRVMSFAAGCSDADWTSVCPGETWPIGVVLEPLPDGYRAFGRWIRG